MEKVERLVGTWKLVRVATQREDGTIDAAPFGKQPSGRLIYTAEGTMAAVISYDGRRPLAADRVAAPAAERAEAFATSFAYAGRYSVAGREVRHHVGVASVENWVGTDLVREFALDGDALTLRTPAVVVGGESRVSELVWVRDEER